jgi:hypothetical protein
MSIQKKSLISTLKTAKKANVASSHEGEAKGSKVSSMRVAQPRPVTAVTAKRMRQLKASHTKSFRAPAFKTIL